MIASCSLSQLSVRAGKFKLLKRLLQVPLQLAKFWLQHNSLQIWFTLKCCPNKQGSPLVRFLTFNVSPSPSYHLLLLLWNYWLQHKTLRVTLPTYFALVGACFGISSLRLWDLSSASVSVLQLHLLLASKQSMQQLIVPGSTSLLYNY